jgi:DNA polymerase III epsilon subunit-like protein
MAINTNYLCCLDFETGNADKYNAIPLELAAEMIDPRTLRRIEGANFHTLIKPHCGWKGVEAKALEINKIDKDEVDKKGLEEKVAFDNFTQFIRKYTQGNKWKAPIMCGFNIEGFDRIIMDKLCIKYNYVDKDGAQKLFHPRDTFDLMKIGLTWFENLPEPDKYNLNAFREFFGISTDGAHRALKDVEDTTDMLCRFLLFHRKVNEKNKPQFKGSFARSC